MRGVGVWWLTGDTVSVEKLEVKGTHLFPIQASNQKIKECTVQTADIK